jgi:integrase
MMMEPGQDTALFGEISPYQDANRWRRMLEAAGVDHVPLHGARGTGASVMQALGTPERYIADLLGHSTARVTQEHYLHSDDRQRLEAVTSMAQWLEAEPGR